jgi:hypothetical protein
MTPALDAHVRDIVAWHFSPETGAPHWIEWARDNTFDVREITGFDDLASLPRFDVALLREAPERLAPIAFADKPAYVFETGGTTGAPTQRWSWRDHVLDYETLAERLDDEVFPRGAHWLMIGPSGPRRLRHGIEILAHARGGRCYMLDLDPRWAKRLEVEGRMEEVRAYKAHIIDQAETLLDHNLIGCLFATPALLEALGDRVDLAARGVRGVICGGTSMGAQTMRFLSEEVLGPKVGILPTYGNTLMGLATSSPPVEANGWSNTYYAPQPRAVLRVVEVEEPDRLVDYGQWGRVELTTLTNELFLPRLLERDEAIRRPPSETVPWDGLGEVRPLGAGDSPVVEGVY